ncbi:MBL fold metallo-hydrolase [Actinacidiphila alni]|uniref:MBL fold metallo-hydrolase n=1 Tax=Actinacidiphila alni TaxID=380248 RepID=UPI003402F694
MAVEITWWGHATVTVRDSGVRVLTDPLFARRLAHLRRRRGAVPPPSAAVADVVLVSHLHADHLHPTSLRRLAPGTTVVVPRGAIAAVPGLRRLRERLRLVEVGAGDSLPVRAGAGHGGPAEHGGEVTVRAVPAAHDGRRLPYGPQRTPALGYVVEGTARTYFAGDTGLFDGMTDAVGPVDVALLPVGGWGPFLGHGHLDAGRAARALADLAPSAAVPVHYGTYWPIGMDAVRPHEFHTPGEEFVRLAGQLAPGVTVHRLEHGESVAVAIEDGSEAAAGAGDGTRDPARHGGEAGKAGDIGGTGREGHG